MKKKRWYFSKMFFGAVLLAIALWGYASLNEEYQTVVELPLVVEPPPDKAIETSVPNEIFIDVIGSGWYLFNHVYFNNLKKCYVALTDANKRDSQYVIETVDMQKGIQNLAGKLTLRQIFPDVIAVKTGDIQSKEVKILPDVKINLKEGFAIVGGIRVNPPTATIKGNNNILDLIDAWKTKSIILDDVSMSISQQIQLSDSLKSIIKVEPGVVTINAAIQPYSEVTLDDIPLQVADAKILKNHELKPVFFSVTLSGGIDVISKISSSDVTVSINYDDLLNDATGIIKPNINIPPYTKVLDYSPKYIFHKEIVKQ